MKLMIIVVNDAYQEAILSFLNDQGHRATLISSTGDFLNYGKSTLLLGIQETYVEDVLSSIQAKINTFDKKEDMDTQVYIMDTCTTKTTV